MNLINNNNNTYLLSQSFHITTLTRWILNVFVVVIGGFFTATKRYKVKAVCTGSHPLCAGKLFIVSRHRIHPTAVKLETNDRVFILVCLQYMF